MISCDQLFKIPPIPFIPRSRDQTDKILKKIIEGNNITIPIVWVKNSLYILGINKVHLLVKKDQLVANVGGGYEKFETYI